MFFIPTNGIAFWLYKGIMKEMPWLSISRKGIDTC